MFQEDQRGYSAADSTFKSDWLQFTPLSKLIVNVLMTMTDKDKWQEIIHFVYSGELF